jgi:hypothetical protein
MSVSVERRTVSLWPVNASPVRSAPQHPRTAPLVRRTAQREDPATQALAAITSSYRNGRAGIIASDPSPAAQQIGAEPPADPPVPTHFPTVPVAFLTKPEPAEIPPEPPADQAGEAAEATEATTLWSRLVRTRRPAPRGRHRPAQVETAASTSTVSDPDTRGPALPPSPA